MQARLIRSRWIATMLDDAPPLRDAAVLVRGGRIERVGPAAELEGLCRRELGDVRPEVEDLGEAVLLPGLINAHTHLELSDAAPPAAPARFGSWLLDLVAGRMSRGVEAPAAAAIAAASGAAESLGCGITCVGDISRFATFTRPALAESPLRVVSFGEVQSMAGRRALLDARLADATDLAHDGWLDAARLLVAVSPHAPYTVEPDAYLRCLDWSRRTGRPLCTHLAETPDEAAFLSDHAGEFRRLWETIGDWSGDVPRFEGGPVRFAASLGLLDHPSLLAHVNYVDDEELAILSRGRAAVVWCPRTHACFDHPPHRFEEMLARGMNVCIGTDSRATSPDLNILEDLRLVRRGRGTDAATLWSMITRRPAAALGIEHDLGTLAPGKLADLVAFPLDRGEADPLEAVLSAPRPPAAMWIAGVSVPPQSALKA